MGDRARAAPFYIPVFAVALLALSQSSAQHPTNELEDLEQRIASAWMKADRDALDGILADDWRVIDISGRLRTKADVFHDMFGPEGPGIRELKVDEVEVRMLRDDLAIVTGRTVGTGNDGTTVELRFTDVAVHRGGRWQVTASQGTPVMK